MPSRSAIDPTTRPSVVIAHWYGPRRSVWPKTARVGHERAGVLGAIGPRKVWQPALDLGILARRMNCGRVGSQPRSQGDRIVTKLDSVKATLTRIERARTGTLTAGRIARTPRSGAGCQRASEVRRVPYVVPYTGVMRKSSVYLSEEQAARLARLAREEGRSQAEILREAIGSYRPRPSGDRNFALEGCVTGAGGSVADVEEQDLLRGFGE